MDQLREDSYVETSKLMMHVNGISMVLIPFIYGDEKVFLVCILFAAAAAYATHLALANRRIRLRAYQLKRFVAAYYIITILCMWSGWASEQHEKLMTIGQLTLFACYCDRSVHIPGQISIAVTDILRFAASSGWQSISVVRLLSSVCFAFRLLWKILVGTYILLLPL